MSCAKSPFVFLGCLMAFRHVHGSPSKQASGQVQLAPAAMTALRGATNATAMHATAGNMPCQCDLGQSGWLPNRRSAPKCIFIDLGAADGNTLKDFVAGKYGAVANCPGGGQWEAKLVEANPRFDAPLKAMEVSYPGHVTPFNSHAAYMCEAKTTFYIDTTSVEHNYWGSSMSANHDDVKKSGKQAVTVPTVNILKLIYESTTPEDYVTLKMDIEGSEWDVLPCLAQSPIASLVDRLLVEVHPATWGNAGTTQPQLDKAMADLRAKGVDIPQYFSQTL